MFSKTMLSKTFLACLLALPEASKAAYTLQDDYSANFFDMFDFFTDADPTNGFVQYVDSGTAFDTGLVKEADGGFYIGTDATNPQPAGRPSVRLTSKNSYDTGLIILDLAHMPASICGTWPAFWTVGPDWPSHGEVDIIEGVNSQNYDAMTLHTGPGCSVGDPSGFTGSVETSNCDINAAGQTPNTGCQIQNPDPGAYGTGFNSAGGGVYAAEITSEYIAMWQFARSEVPSDIAAGTPDPANWPTPAAKWMGACDIPSFVNQQQIVFDLTFCGDWAGDAFSSDPVCAAKGSCTDYVANNPNDFAQAYWQVNDLKVFSGSGSGTNGSYPNATQFRRSPIAESHSHRGLHARHLLKHIKN